ncbi:hypothetical protein NA56DRAFT_279572 [Hyaloscypha hepaticicola]|uniref:Uncharacterized protein n=1 Tax=Hyaloscypha hepaticicola TaxID=2082293 RepID=A0A2J6PST5_9HELO|nr:hypothetical protein NA56DRAFT_279572 [Hyaloscypha hepaticicola]
MSSVNPFRLKLSRLRNRYYFDTSSSEEESALEADFDPKESEAHVASPSIASTESSVVDDDGTHSVAIININNLNGMYGDTPDTLLQSSSLELPVQVTEFDFETESITEEVIRDAAEDLLEFASEVIKDTDSVQTTLVFLAGDLGGSVLKQVSCDGIPRYESANSPSKGTVLTTNPRLFLGSCRGNTYP